MTAGTIREPDGPRRTDVWVDLLEDGLRWQRVAQRAVTDDDVETAQRAYLRRNEIADAIAARCGDLTRYEVLARLHLISRVESESEPVCSCGIRFVYAGAIAWSAEWHRSHRRVHLDVFPNVDARTREILDENVERAESTRVTA